MHALVLLMIVAVTTFAYGASIGWLPRILVYTPELMSLVVAMYVVVVGVRDRFRFVHPAYWLLFASLTIVVICGALVNNLQPGPAFAGLRYYLRALPFFLLPAVLLIEERHLRKQLVLLTGLCLIQLPLAWVQRNNTIEAAAQRGLQSTTGDLTFGTLMQSGHLSLFLIGAACILAGFYLRKRISAPRFLVLMLLILLPTSLNETKITIVALPIALLMSMWAGAAQGQRLKNLMLGVVLIVGFAAIFLPIYDYYIRPKWGYGLVEFFTMEGRVEGYLSTGAEIGDTQKGGRLDGVNAAIGLISRDPAKLAFGVGIGNGSDSALGYQFEGAYRALFEHLPKTALKLFVLEMGFLGLALIFLLHGMIFLHALAVTRWSDGAYGALAIGWTGVSVVIALSIPYVEIVASSTFSYLYWFYSGALVAYHMRQRWAFSADAVSSDGQTVHSASVGEDKDSKLSNARRGANLKRVS